jgi:hypothetical protein
MITLILSIIFWCMSENKNLGNIVIILSILGIIVDLIFSGWLCIIDIIILIINICVYNKE